MAEAIDDAGNDQGDSVVMAEANDDAGNDQGDSVVKAFVVRAYARNPKLTIGVGLAFAVVTLVAALALVWFAWFRVIPAVSDWAFDPTIWWRATLAVFAFLFLAVFPPYALAIPIVPLAWLAEASLGAEEAEMRERLSVAERRQQHLEVEIVELAGESGLEAVLPMRISRWSGAQLEAYYKTGIDQARRSFRYSVLAMWLGFIVLVAGVTIQLVNPLERWGLEPTTTDINFIVVAAGLIIEFIAALFLWVHRSALQNLSRLYDAQMYRHSVILSNQLAQGIDTAEMRDQTRQLIISSLLVPPNELMLKAPEAKASGIPGLARSVSPTAEGGGKVT